MYAGPAFPVWGLTVIDLFIQLFFLRIDYHIRGCISDNIQDKLGVAPKEFCNDIIQNGESSARSKHLLNAAVNTIQFAAIWLFIKYFLSSPYTIAWSDLLLVFFVFLSAYMLSIRFYEPVNRPIMIADGWLVITVAAAIAAAATMLSNIYWQRCARKYTC